MYGLYREITDTRGQEQRNRERVRAETMTFRVDCARLSLRHPAPSVHLGEAQRASRDQGERLEV